MLAVAELQRDRAGSLVRGALRSLAPGASMKAAVRSLAERSGLSPRKIDSIRRGEPCRVRPSDIDALKKATGDNHAAIFAAAARSLDALDPVAHREDAARLRRLAHLLGRLDRDGQVAP